MSAESKIIILEQDLYDGQGKKIAAAPDAEDLRLLFGQPLSGNNTLPASCLDNCQAIYPPGQVYLAGTGSSSFDSAHQLIRRGDFPEWAAVILVRQDAGRGQLRRPWTSQAGNLFVSYRLPDLHCPDEALSVVTGLLWVLALSGMGYNLKLKWPNDLIQYGPNGPEKVGGILIEERNGIAVAGVGLNIRHAPPLDRMREDYVLPGGRLAPPPQGADPDLMAFYAEKQGLAHFWTKLAAAMFSCYFDKSGNNRDWWRPLAEGVLAFAGRLVEVADHNFGQSIRGVVAGLHNDGSLLLQTEKGLISINGGSPRPLGAV